MQFEEKPVENRAFGGFIGEMQGNRDEIATNASFAADEHFEILEQHCTAAQTRGFQVCHVGSEDIAGSSHGFYQFCQVPLRNVHDFPLEFLPAKEKLRISC